MLFDPITADSRRQAAESAAHAIVSLLTGFISPRSVLDVGCGEGTWLDAYRRAGVADYFGVDGRDARGGLRIPPDRFAAHDLAAPFDLGRRFDLVHSLNVAERLPSASAAGFVRSLARHGDAILFSAAIPHQGGAGHVNEQWPDYWAELFRLVGFATYDWVRPRVWGDDRVAWWYAQSSLLFVREGLSAGWARQLPRPAPAGPILRLVHPGQHRRTVEAGRPPAAQPGPSTPFSSATVTVRRPTRPYDVAVVIPTIGRQTLERAIRSVYAQDFSGTIQIAVGIDGWGEGERDWLAGLAAEAPSDRDVLVFDPGYSTATRRGGFFPAGDGGALRTILSYAAHSRLVAYLDDDNWWAPNHLATLTEAIAGHDWAYSLRWYAEQGTGRLLCVDTWESVGVNRGVYAARFGGFVDPSCLLIDKVACEPALRLWCHPIAGDPAGMSTDRTVFNFLRSQRRGAGTGLATAYYTLNPSDVNHTTRLRLINSARRGQTEAGHVGQPADADRPGGSGS